MKLKFTKEELKTGMILEDEGRKLGLILLGTTNGDIVSGETWYPLSSVTDAELFGGDSYSDEPRTIVRNVVRVWQPRSNCHYLNYGDKLSTNGCDLLWERKETKNMTKSQIEEELGYFINIIE